MIIFKHFKGLQEYLSKNISSSKTIGFVPTMGALHSGHLSLINQCKEKAGITICSIFVNPLQFNNPEDLKKYPTSPEKDSLFLEESGCDILLLPEEKELYPTEASKINYFEIGEIENRLEGKYRPGHFQGVCLVMEKFLNAIKPHYLFLGQKDYQQCLVIKQLIRLMNKDIQMVVCPTLREVDGLAMSSRNARLTSDERSLAPELYKTLCSVKTHLSSDNFPAIKMAAIRQLENSGFTVDYLELAKAENLKIVSNVSPDEKYVLLLAAYLNKIRLIDNVLI